MPHHPPLCPAFTQSQALTLSPIQETANSPLHAHEEAVFSNFSWTGLFSPIPASRGASPMLGSDSSGVLSPGSPGQLLKKLDKLSLFQAAPLEPASVGLGFDLHIKLSGSPVAADKPVGKDRRHSSVSCYTPANTPACARNRRRYSSFLARDAVHNYEEDAIDSMDLGAEENEADLLPMMGWLQNRLEEAARREQYESEIEQDDIEMPESSTLADIQTAVLIQKKVVKIEMSRAIANLRRTESVLQTPTRAATAKVGVTASLQDDRDSPRNSIFSPPVIAPRRASIVLGATRAAQPAGPPSIASLHKQHKRKASTLSERSFLSAATGKNKKVRRSSLSSLSNVSNALSPILSDAFMNPTAGEVDEFGVKEHAGRAGRRGLQRTLSFLGGRV